MRENTLKKILYYSGVSTGAIFILTPVTFMILAGLNQRADFLDGPLIFTIENFSELLSRSSSTHFPDYLFNSGVISAVSALISTVIAGLGAYAFTRFSFPGRMVLSVAILALSMFPQISIVGYLFRLTAAIGLTNTRTGLVIPYTAWVLPLSMWILISYFKQVPRDLDKAAHIDGCTPLQTIRYVILPIAAPELLYMYNATQYYLHYIQIRHTLIQAIWSISNLMKTNFIFSLGNKRTDIDNQMRQKK